MALSFCKQLESLSCFTDISDQLHTNYKLSLRFSLKQGVQQINTLALKEIPRVEGSPP